jgi:hypothetical protein
MPADRIGYGRALFQVLGTTPLFLLKQMAAI